MKKYLDRFVSHQYGLTLAAFIFAAVFTGFACVWFMWLFEAVIRHRLDPERVGYWCLLTTPALFLLSVGLVRRWAPLAEGAGIPQVAFAAEEMTPKTYLSLSGLTSMRTMAVKVAALLIAVAAGASTGREGPTVHVAACLFLGVLLLLRRFLPLKFDLRSAVVAGGAAGLAAAFNTPLAGVTFAIEELSTDYFGSIKELVLVAIIIAAVAAKSLTGEYGYFGRLADPAAVPLGVIVVISLACGLLGAFFSTSIARGRAAVRRVAGAKGMAITALFSLLVVALSRISGPEILGPGNGAAQTLLQGSYAHWALAFPASKLLATLLTYWSGIAGGIFAPCLAIGAALGADVGAWAHCSIGSCALIGMAAFLSGTIQAPITSFVIIFEMTGHHEMLLPVMLASLLSTIVAKLCGAHHLYHQLSETYRFLLEGEKA